jgi:Rieske Fe-S protein
MTAPQRPGHHLHRRTVAGALTIGLGLPVLAACGGGDSSTDTATDPNTPTPSGSEPTASESSTPTESSSAPVDGFAQTSEIEVGGGTVYPDEQIVITQPTEGQFKCFTAVCTHQGCIVSSVSGGVINCACHGSAFSIADGSVVNGPATQPLAAEAISVEGDAIVLG